MLAKLTSKNQITIPKKIIEKFPDTRHFNVDIQNGAIELPPLVTYDTDLSRIRSKMEQLGITGDTVAEALAWARKK